MAYNNNIPLGATNISVGQGQILTNFGTSGIDSTTFGFSREHVTMTDATNGGIHKQVTFQAPLTPSAPTGSVSLEYSKNITVVSPASTIAELHFRNATAETQITSSALLASSGEGFIPGGLQIRCGSASSNGSGVTNSFTKQFPTACLSVVLTGSNTSQTTNIMKVSSFSQTGFVAKSPLGEAGYYIAVGY